MNLSLLPRKLAQLLGALVACLVAYSLLSASGLNALAARETEGIGVLIQLMGDIYAVLLAFMIFVIWTQFTEVENCVVREANSLQELFRYSAFLNDDARIGIRKAVSNYVKRILTYEWDELGNGREDSQTAEMFSRLVSAVVTATQKDDNDRALRDHLLEALRTTSRNRDERVSKSLTRMPPTLSGLVKLIAGVLLVLILLYPFHQPSIGSLCVAIAALVLFVSDFVMTDTDNPLKGLWNVRSDAFSDVPH